MNTQTRNIILIVIALVAARSSSPDAVYIVTETNQVIITQFGEPIGGAVTKAGVHLKMPFIQKTNYFEKRWLEWEGDAEPNPDQRQEIHLGRNLLPLADQRSPRFFQRVQDERGAQSRLDDIVDGEARNAVANYDLIEIVRSSNRAFEQSEEAASLDSSDVAGQDPARAGTRSPRSSSKRPTRSRPNSGSRSRTSRSSGSITSTRSRRRSSIG